MKTRSAITFGPLTLGLSALLIGSMTAGGLAVASSRAQSHAEKQGAAEAGAAQRALARGSTVEAIRHGEAAVAFQPRVASYRVTLGQSYLKGGRFASARDAFADALTLDDGNGNGRAALNLALAQIATGDWAGARITLDAHAAIIPVGDRGLAIALAGDPATAVELLGAAARAPGASATIRQNYALSLALAGRWREAQAVVAIDLAPADVTRRILQWSTFSRPKAASDQVATLLGVMPAVDPGLPVALALDATVRAGVAQAELAPVDTFMPGQVAEKADIAAQPAPLAPAPVPTPVVVATTAEPAVAPIGPGIGGIVFAERREIVQALPVSVAQASVKRAAPKAELGRLVALASRPVAKGTFYVQVGAYRNAGVAHDAWGRVARRYAAFAGHTPQGMTMTSGGASFYRLSVGGFTRADAVSLCKGYRVHGGACFVRAGAGDQVALWAKGRELASR